MIDQFLAGRLRTLALCESSTPPEAISALIGAACSIMLAQFTPQQASALLMNAIDSAYASISPPVDVQAH